MVVRHSLKILLVLFGTVGFLFRKLLCLATSFLKFSRGKSDCCIIFLKFDVMKSIQLADRIQKSITNNTMSWFNGLLGWIFKYPDLVLVIVWALYSTWDLLTRLILKKEIDFQFAGLNLLFGVIFSVGMYYWLLPKIVLWGEWKSGLAYLLFFAAVLILLKFQIRFSEWFWKVDFKENLLEIARMVNFQFVTFVIWILLVYFLLQKDNLQKKALVDELDFYHKSMQLGPHFVLNMMMEISDRARDHSKELSEEIEQFSTVLKYGYKDIRSDNSLLDEILTIKSYEYCQRKRFGDSMNHWLSIRISEETAAQLPIPKMTLLSLYADVFKHGDYTGEFPCSVVIRLTNCPIRHNTQLIMTVYNLIGNRKYLSDSGFGLKAVINVLTYYFGEDFKLYHEANENEFSLLLTIDYG